MKLFTSAIVFVILTGCSISYDQIEQARQLCEPNEGVDFIRADKLYAICKNGALFDLKDL